MKRRTCAERVGVRYETAWRWFKAGKIKGRQLGTCTIIVTEDFDDINAGVILSRLRAEIAAFSRAKDVTIFFASMAHLFPEHASHAVSRESEAALIPREKRAPLAQPLRQNAPKPARIFTGADNEPVEVDVIVVVYARVSANENRPNLDTQAERLSASCAAKGWKVHKVVKEVGSGMNDGRKKLLAILADPTVKIIVVEHKDRLTRFGFT